MRNQMTHNELMDYARSMGLKVYKDSFYSDMHRSHMVRVTIWHPCVTPGKRGHENLIAAFKVTLDAEYNEYWDACGILENTLRQYESWR